MKYFVVVFLFILPFIDKAQCAMCRTQIQTNVSANDNMDLASGLNAGILFLVLAPYSLLAIIIFLWLRYNKISLKNVVGYTKNKISKA